MKIHSEGLEEYYKKHNTKYDLIRVKAYDTYSHSYLFNSFSVAKTIVYIRPKFVSFKEKIEKEHRRKVFWQRKNLNCYEMILTVNYTHQRRDALFITYNIELDSVVYQSVHLTDIDKKDFIGNTLMNTTKGRIIKKNDKYYVVHGYKHYSKNEIFTEEIKKLTHNIEFITELKQLILKYKEHDV